MADKEGRGTEREFNPALFFMVIIITIVGLFTAGIIAGQLWYQEETFTATVTSIEYYGDGGIIGSTRVSVHFDDGRVYDSYKIPELREGQKYTIEYRTPYFLEDPYLVVISGGQN